MEIQNWKMEGGVLTRLPNQAKGRKKAEGFMLVSAALASLVWILIAQCAAVLTSSSINDRKTSKMAEQAEMYGNIEIEKLKNTSYSDLATQAHKRQAMDGVGDGNWESEVTLGDEQALGSGDNAAKMRVAHIAIYRKGDDTSRFSADIPVTTYGVITAEGDKHGSIIYTGGHYSLPAGTKEIYVEGEKVTLDPNETPYLDTKVETVTDDSDTLHYEYTGWDWASWNDGAANQVRHGSGGVIHCEYKLKDGDYDLDQTETKTVHVYFGEKEIYSTQTRTKTTGHGITDDMKTKEGYFYEHDIPYENMSPEEVCRSETPSYTPYGHASSTATVFTPGLHISW